MTESAADFALEQTGPVSCACDNNVQDPNKCPAQ